MTTNLPIPKSALPHTDADMIKWLQLARSRRVGPTTFLRLLNEYGTPAAAIDALPGIAAAAGEKTYEACPPGIAARELAQGHRAGARLLCLGTEGYPWQLHDLTDPPPVLWAVGRPELATKTAVALVGARNASAVGRRMAEKLARDLGAAGIIVISGLARGIDQAAHAASLDSGTIAVLAGGVDVIYPKETADLFRSIGERGLRLSEMPPGLQPQARHFPRRNRIVSGLAHAVVVVEGAAKSGSLITARNALDQGRDVLAVPGHPMDARAAGCNILIRDGATLVRAAEDVLEVIERAVEPLPLAPPGQSIHAPIGGLAKSDPQPVKPCTDCRGPADPRNRRHARCSPSRFDRTCGVRADRPSARRNGQSRRLTWPDRRCCACESSAGKARH